MHLAVGPLTPPGVRINGQVTLLGIEAEADIRLDDSGFAFEVDGKLLDLFEASVAASGGHLGGPGGEDGFMVSATLKNDLLAVLREHATQAIADASQEATRRIASARQDLADAQARLDALDSQIADARHTVQAERDAAQRRLADAQRAVADAQARLDGLGRQADAARATVQAERATAQQRLADARRAVDDAQHTVDSLAQQIGATRATVQAERAQAQRGIDAASAKVNAAQASVNGLQAQIDALKRWYYGLPRTDWPWKDSQATRAVDFAARVGALYTALGTAQGVLAAAQGECPAPRAVQAQGTLAPTGVDQRVWATLAFDGGVVSQFTCGVDGPADNALRIFGDAPGAYSAGVNRLAERSGAWREREELGRVYLNRMGHAYGLDASGDAAHQAFETALSGVARSYHGRASNLYGLLDNNDAFDYLGGMSVGIETLTGRRPEGLILQHADPAHPAVEPLTTALLSELRGRYLNPEWLKPLMKHGYAGARTMGQEFLENLWGWQVTRPDLIRQWAWDEVKETWFDDKHKLGLPRFLAQGHNAHVKAQMLAVFMVAAEKGFWQADDATLKQMGGELARLVAKNGLPGSGHTAPNHPMWNWLKPRIDAADADALGVALARARGEGLAPAPIAHPTSMVAAPRQPGARHDAPTPRGEAAAPPPPAAAELQAPAERHYELHTRPAPPATRPTPPVALLTLAPLLFLLGLAWSRRAPPTSTPT